MKRIISTLISLLMVVVLHPNHVFAFSSQGKSANLVSVPGQQTATVKYGTWLEGENSTMDIIIRDVSENANIPDGTYVGWCIEEFVSGELHYEQAMLYGSIEANLPPDVDAFPWNKINYVLNHKIRGENRTDLDYYKDVQTAIWMLLGEEKPEFGITPEALQMVEEANNHPDFVPEGGDVVAVIIYYDGIDQTKYNSVQEAIIEVKLDENKAMSLTKTANPSTYDTVGQLITYTYIINNTGNVTLTGPFLVIDDKTTVNCVQPTSGVLSLGEMMTCSASYSITQADLDAGSVKNTASASGDGISTPEVTETITVSIPNPNLSFLKESFLDMTIVQPNDQADIGDVISYTLTATNNGNVALTNVIINDPQLSILSCTPTQPATLAPDESIVCSGNYTLTQPDIFNRVVENTADATSDQTSLISTSNTTPILQPFSHISLTKSTPTTSYDQVGQIIIFSLVATNDGNATLTDVSISDPLIGTLTCSQPVTLFPGESLTCTGSYTITQTDLDTGSLLNTATVSGTDSDNQLITNETSQTILASNICQPTVVVADFSQIPVGSSVEGIGMVAPYLDIDAKGTAVKILEATSPKAYGAPNSAPILNGGLSTEGGFSDASTAEAQQAHQYTFTFAGLTVSDFSLRMLDYGDWNPTLSTDHRVSLTAYDVNGTVVAQQEVSYTTPGVPTPHNSSLYGDLWFTGDAVASSSGQLGNWTWNLSGSGIVSVVLEFGVGFDPNVGFDTLSFTTECLQCQSLNAAADFSQIPVGSSVEGIGMVAPYLDIDAKGTAVKILEATSPKAYGAPNSAPILNGGLSTEGGFSDASTAEAQQAHQYTFTFAGLTVSDFSLRMLDYGDWNPTLSTDHRVSLTAYDVNGTVVAQQEVSYTTPGVPTPHNSSLYGDLWFTGDAVASSSGQLGNWTWNIFGGNIASVVLEFGVGFDPNVGFDTLSFTTECIQ